MELKIKFLVLFLLLFNYYLNNVGFINSYENIQLRKLILI